MFLVNITTRLLVIRFLSFQFACARVKSCGEKEQHFSVIMVTMFATENCRMIGDVRGSSAEAPRKVDAWKLIPSPVIPKLQSSRWFRSSESLQTCFCLRVLHVSLHPFVVVEAKLRLRDRFA